MYASRVGRGFISGENFEKMDRGKIEEEINEGKKERKKERETLVR